MEVPFGLVFFLGAFDIFIITSRYIYSVIRSVSKELRGRTGDDSAPRQFLCTGGEKGLSDSHVVKYQALLSLAYLSECDLISASSYSFHVSGQDLILCMCIFRVITGLIHRNPPCWQFLSNYHCPVWETQSLCFSLRLCIIVCFIFSEEFALQYF